VRVWILPDFINLAKSACDPQDVEQIPRIRDNIASFNPRNPIHANFAGTPPMSSELVQLLMSTASEIGRLEELVKTLESRVESLERQLSASRDEASKVASAKSSKFEHPGKAGAVAAVAAVAERTSHPATMGGIKVLERPPQPMFVPPSPDAPPPPPLRPDLFEPIDDYADAHAASDAPKRPFVKWLPTTDTELPMIEARCRLKADAARWAAERRRLLNEGKDFRTDIEPRDRELIALAKQLPDCFLWMSHPTAPNPHDVGQWHVLAGCFDVLSDAVALIRRILDEPEETPELFGQAVDLLAEAQSGLRMIVARLEGPPTDHDQARVFGWLKSVAMNRQIFIRRYMRLDDPADPERWIDLRNRIANFQVLSEDGRKKITQRKKALSRLKHKLSQLVGMSLEERLTTWMSIAGDVDELVTSGMPPSNVELRDSLAAHVDDLPEMATMPKGFQLTIREIDKYLASLPDKSVEAETDETSPQISEVADMLAGKAVIIIGGDRRPFAAEALERSFLLSELIWIDTRAHESISGFEPYVARPEVAMVLLAIRWSSHSYGEVQDFCRTYGKPLVRLPGGYNPNQVAAQILEQCSQRLST
jgi:hypothetical protein